MKQVLWTLYDKRTKYFQPPALYRSDDFAIVQMQRNIAGSLLEGKMNEQILDDYQFVKLAEYDDATGSITPLENLEFHACSVGDYNAS